MITLRLGGRSMRRRRVVIADGGSSNKGGKFLASCTVGLLAAAGQIMPQPRVRMRYRDSHCAEAAGFRSAQNLTLMAAS